MRESDTKEVSERLREEVNRFRSDPKSYARVIEERLPFYKDDIFFLIDRPDSAISTK